MPFSGIDGSQAIGVGIKSMCLLLGPPAGFKSWLYQVVSPFDPGSFTQGSAWSVFPPTSWISFMTSQLCMGPTPELCSG
jgi:hypothetical protein